MKNEELIMMNLPGFVVVFGLSGVYGYAPGRRVARRAEVFLRLVGSGVFLPRNAVEVIVRRRLVHGVGLHLRAPAYAHLGVGLEGVLDALGHEEAGVDAAVLRGVEFVWVSFHPPAALVVPLPVLLGGVVGEPRPVFLEHHGVVHRAVGTGNLHEAGHDVAALVGQVAGVLHGLAPVVVREGEAVFLVDDDGVVGILYLPRPRTHHQLAVAGDGEREAAFVGGLALRVLAHGVAARLQVAQGAHAGLHGEAAHGQVDEGGEHGEAGDAGEGLGVVLHPVAEVVQLAFVGGLAGAFAPQGVPDLDELVSDGWVRQDVGGLQLL